jgi:hypothetical protein
LLPLTKHEHQIFLRDDVKSNILWEFILIVIKFKNVCKIIYHPICTTKFWLVHSSFYLYCLKINSYFQIVPLNGINGSNFTTFIGIVQICQVFQKRNKLQTKYQSGLKFWTSLISSLQLPQSPSKCIVDTKAWCTRYKLFNTPWMLWLENPSKLEHTLTHLVW